jgi:glucose-1-phosphate cytidylyltransferase
MDVVIFCGGRGTRLSEKTKEIPKPLVEIGDYPIIWHIMKIFERYGHKRFILTLGYKGELLKRWFLNYRFNQSFEIDFKDMKPIRPIGDWKVMLKDTGLESGTGRRLGLVKEDIKTRQFFVTYGDGLSDIDLDRLLSFHNKMRKERGVVATISLFNPRSRFGIVRVGENNLVGGFEEKPMDKEWANMGFLVCEREIFNYIKGDESGLMLEWDILPKLAKEGKLAAYRHSGFFEPMDTFKDYTNLNEMWKSDRAKWKIW